MKKAKITYEVIKTEKGKLYLRNGPCMVQVKDIPENNGLISTLETDLDFAIEKKQKDETN